MADHHVMCFAHVVDLTLGHVIHKVKAYDRDVVNDAEPPSTPIELTRFVVRVIWASGMHWAAFDEVIINGNNKHWFKQGEPPKVVKVEQMQLLRDA